VGGRRSGAQSRRVGVAGGWIQRRQPKKSGVQKLIGGAAGVLPGAGKGRSKATASAGKAKQGGAVGGLALLAAAAGMAFKNRDKITSKLSGNQSSAPKGSAVPGTTGSPAAEPVVADVQGPPMAGTSPRDTEPSRTDGGPARLAE